MAVNRQVKIHLDSIYGKIPMNYFHINCIDNIHDLTIVGGWTNSFRPVLSG